MKKKPIIYLSTVKDQYDHPLYPKIRRRIREIFPGCRLIEPARSSWDREAWLQTWRRILPELDLLIIWPRPDGTVGAGILQEILDAAMCERVEIRILMDPSSPLVPLEGVELLPNQPPARMARVIPGKEGSCGET